MSAVYLEICIIRAKSTIMTLKDNFSTFPRKNVLRNCSATDYSPLGVCVSAISPLTTAMPMNEGGGKKSGGQPNDI